MQKIHIRRIIYILKHQYLNLGNVVLVGALLVGLSMAYSAAQSLQRNYALQREIDTKRRTARLLELQSQNLEFEQQYFKSNEYLMLESKRRLGLAEPGEKLLILSPNTKDIQQLDQQFDSDDKVKVAIVAKPASNLDQWLDFFSGKQIKALQNTK